MLGHILSLFRRPSVEEDPAAISAKIAEGKRKDEFKAYFYDQVRRLRQEAVLPEKPFKIVRVDSEAHFIVQHFGGLTDNCAKMEYWAAIEPVDSLKGYAVPRVYFNWKTIHEPFPTFEEAENWLLTFVQPGTAVKFYGDPAEVRP